jgi:hypothetical protein
MANLVKDLLSISDINLTVLAIFVAIIAIVLPISQSINYFI